MAFRKRYGGSSNSKVIMSTLGGLVGLLLSLWVFEKIIDVVLATINLTGIFADTISFVQEIIPVVGIIAGYIMIKGALKRMSF